MLKDLLGTERDAECVKFVSKQIFNTLLKRVKPTKSLALMFDGTDPLWRLRRGRAYPGRHFESRFYRSAASPMVYSLEDKLLQGVVEMTKVKSGSFDEFLISGPATVGSAESKISQWMLDLASKSGSKNESVCLIGGSDLFMSALGAVPFYNVTTMSTSSADFKSLSVKETFEWLLMENLFTNATAANDVEAAKRLAQVRTDVVLLLLICNGISATDLQGAGIGFKDVMDAYSDLVAGGEKRNEVFYLTTDDGPHGSVRLHCAALEKLMSRATKKVGVARVCKTSSDYLEILLQSHAMICSGGVLNYRFVHRGESILQPKPPILSLESFIGYLKHLSQQTADNGTVHASVDLSFALTPAEQLLVSSPNTALIDQILPLYSGGHVLPPSVGESITGTKDIEEALEKAKSVLAGIGEGGTASHRGATHSPSHYYIRGSALSKGPPMGFDYSSVNLGIKSRVLDTRRVTFDANAKEETVVDLGAGGAKNVLVVFNTDTNLWVTTPCADVPPPAPAGVRTVPSTLRCVTWNVQFNKHSGEQTPLGRAGIDWCSTTRYVALSKILEDTDADIIGMQEVETAWWTYLSQQPWVQENYTFTCAGDSPLLSPWGVLVLVHRRVAVASTALDNVAGFSGHTSIMPSVSVRLTPTTTVAVKSFHLLAPYSSNHISNRVTQVQNLVRQLTSKSASPHTILMGDFNDFPAQFLRLPQELRFKDAWEQIYPETQDPTVPHGYTIDGTKNPYAALIIEPQFNGRADRILSSSNRLQPIEAQLLGTTTVQDMVNEGKITLPPNAKCPVYLHPSDHFGVMAEFQVL
ncbi:RNA editing 3 exouridylylase MP99, putative [Bodo saltans]|uniref:RNA editing 3 exouridylylase MP99, putative n=1 Tax=Bodo saltans TaxID=75058 RepID=A0A0S4J9X6_BODSA|nr:RNA editing 3 exouridylylase MP99, putative [Bodo saltans]|eukprot:CUG88136.1 RNA editing 3 exouridylylase MP99, putative [Bodo saltans]